MEELFSKKNSLITFRQINLKVIAYNAFTFRFKNEIQYVLPDSSYGEWIFYELGIPRYYYNSFTEKGDVKPLVKEANRSGLEIPDMIKLKLEKIVGNEIVIGSQSNVMIKTSKERIVNLTLNEIID